MISDTTYALSGWLWETHLQKPIKESAKVHDVHIMHWDGQFMGGPRALRKSALWVVDGEAVQPKRRHGSFKITKE